MQRGIAGILEAIYEADFLDCSYGFRPGRSCHQAINSVDKTIMTKPINHVIEADIKGFFDHVSHGWLMKFLQVRIKDPSFLLLIRRFMKAGYIDAGMMVMTDRGTPQGGNLSPVVSNVFLHYVLDLWFEKKIRPQARGACYLVRYFDFLGFTHFCGQSRRGKFIVVRKTSGKKFRTKIKAMNAWLKAVRNARKVKDWWPTLAVKLQGHYQYYGVSGNMRGLQRFYHRTLYLVRKWLNRRSQRKSFSWEGFMRYLEHYPLPMPRIVHKVEYCDTL